MERLALIFLAKEGLAAATRACGAALSATDCTDWVVEDRDLLIAEAADFALLIAPSLKDEPLLYKQVLPVTPNS